MSIKLQSTNMDIICIISFGKSNYTVVTEDVTLGRM